MSDEDADDMFSIECPKCQGSGVVSDAPRGIYIADGADMKPCPACGGTGAYHDDRRTP